MRAIVSDPAREGDEPHLGGAKVMIHAGAPTTKAALRLATTSSNRGCVELQPVGTARVAVTATSSTSCSTAAEIKAVII